VSAHETDRPVADAANGPDAIRDTHLADLRERPAFDDVIVGPQLVIESPRAGAFTRSHTPTVSERLRRLDRLPRLIEVCRADVEQTPAFALVVDVLADGALDQSVERELLPLNVVAVHEEEVREQVAEDLRDADAFVRLAVQRPIDDRMTELHRDAPRRLPVGHARARR